MSHRKKLVIAMSALWAVIFAASLFFSMQVEGPRNIDTGFQRLDVLARYQILAFAVAVASAIAGLSWRRDGKWVMLLGLAPMLVTAVLIVALVGGTMLFNPSLTPQEAYQPPKQVAPAADHLAPAQD